MKLNIPNQIIIFSFIADAITTIAITEGHSFYRYSLIYRLVIEIYLIFYFIRYFPRYHQYITLIILLTGAYLIGGSFYYYNYSNADLLGSFIVFNKTIYFILIILFFMDHVNDPKFINRIQKYVKIFFTINNCIIIISFLFGFDYFSSYSSLYDGESSRFGYKGLIPTQNEITGVYLFGLYIFFRDKFIYQKENSFLLISTIICTLLIGTKGGIIALITVGGYYLFKYKIKNTLFIGMPILIIIFSYFTSQLKYLWKHYYYFYDYFIFHSDVSLFSFLLSGRNLKFKEMLAKLSGNYQNVEGNWSAINTIFGGADLTWVNSEMDIVDGFILHGLFFVPYLIFLFRVFIKYDKSFDNKVMFFIFISIASFGGHLLFSAVIPMYFCFYIFTFKQNNYYTSKMI